MDLYSELFTLIDVLNAERVEYALCVGIAVAIHGFVRFTGDFDFVVRPEDMDRLVAVLDAQGFILDFGILPTGAGEEIPCDIRRISKGIGEELLTLDMILINPQTQDVWDSRQTVEWRRRHLTVVSKQGLMKLKLMARRSKDLIDLQELGLLDEPDAKT